MSKTEIIVLNQRIKTLEEQLDISKKVIELQKSEIQYIKTSQQWKSK